MIMAMVSLTACASCTAPDANWKAGRRFGGNATRSDIENWIAGLGIK